MLLVCLIHELLKSNPKVIHIELTLEKYTEGAYYGINLPMASDSTMSRFIRIVFAKIVSIFDFEINNAIITRNYERIDNAFESYMDNFMELSSENQFNMSIFEAFSNLKVLQSNRLKYKQDIVKECIALLGNSSKYSDKLSDLLMLLIEINFCLNPTKFHLISFDGIEYLINRIYHIYDSDINDIVLAFENTKQRAEELFEKCNLKFAHHFKLEPVHIND